MSDSKRVRWVRLSAVGFAAASTLLVGACGQDTAGPNTGAEVEDVQQQPPAVAAPDVGVAPNPDIGAFDNDFSDTQNYVGQQVTVSADVNEVISPTAFTIAGTENTTVDELPVLHSQGAPNVTPDSAVQVTGTVRQGFALPAVEQFVGSDLDDGLFSDWLGQNYIEATSIDTTVAEPGEERP